MGFLLDILDELHIRARLLFNTSSVSSLIDESVESDNAAALAILIRRPEVFDKLDSLLELTVRKSRRRSFKLLAAFAGEERFHRACSGGEHMPFLLVKSGNTGMLQALVELEFNLNAPAADGKTMAFLALEEGKIDIFRFLVDAIKQQRLKDSSKPGKNWIDASSGEYPPLLPMAIFKKRIEEVKFLLAAGASPNPVPEDVAGLGRLERLRRTKTFKKCFIQLAIEAQSAELLEMLIDAGASLSPANKACLLEVAMSHPDMSLVKLLVRKMDNDAVNSARDGMNNSMLNKAIIDNNLPMAEFFISYPGTKLNELNFRGITPICEAAANKRTDIMDLLVKAGVDLNATVDLDSGHTLLHASVLNHNESVVRWLFMRDLDANAVDARGNTALDLAVDLKDTAMIELLLDNDKTDVNAGARGSKEIRGRFVHRRPPLLRAVKQMIEAPDIAESTRMTNVVVLLIDLEADVNAQDSSGGTALHLMARELNVIKAQYGARGDRVPNMLRILKALIARGFRLDIADDSGNTPLDVAGQGKEDLTMLFPRGDTRLLPPSSASRHSARENGARTNGTS
jgi:ankyrin repeat protein